MRKWSNKQIHALAAESRDPRVSFLPMEAAQHIWELQKSVEEYHAYLDESGRGHPYYHKLFWFTELDEYQEPYDSVIGHEWA